MKLCKFYGSKLLLHDKPIYYNGLTYITNVRYVLRFSWRLEDAADVTEKNQNMAAYMESLFPRPDEIAGMLHASRHLDWAKVTKCRLCKGHGITKKCDECEGSGEVSFENDYHTYEFECQSCDGYRITMAIWGDKGAARCSYCQGFGREVDEGYFPQPVCIGKAQLSPNQMFRLSHLPLIAWAEHGIDGHFVFCGGDGVLLGSNTDGAD